MPTSPAALRWATIIESQERSGQTVRQFARDQGLNPNTLAWWRSRLKRPDAVGQPGFMEFSVVASPAVAGRPSGDPEPVLVVELPAVGASVRIG